MFINLSYSKAVQVASGGVFCPTDVDRRPSFERYFKRTVADVWREDGFVLNIPADGFQTHADHQRLCGFARNDPKQAERIDALLTATTIRETATIANATDPAPGRTNDGTARR